MKPLSYLILFSLGLFLFSCSSEKLEDIQIEQEKSTNNSTDCSSPEPVSYTVNSNSITVTSWNSNVTFMAIHKASNFAYIESLCDSWNGGAPNCNNPALNSLTSDNLAIDDYLLKVSTSTGFCWIPFSIDPLDLVAFNSSNGTINITYIDPSITRLDIHNLDYSEATPVSSICNTWSTICNAPISKSGFSTGTRLLRIERPGVPAIFKIITIN